jgi:predicted LPLAT superfamily acyltransferase
LARRATFYDVYRHYHTFASCVLDRVFFLRGRHDLFDVQIHGEEIVTEILKQGNGCILLGAHIGSFEALRLVGRTRANLRLNMLMFEENAKKVNSILKALDPELAKDVICLGRPGSFMNVQGCLDRGHFVGVLADRSLSNERQVSLPFLGKPSRFSLSPFRILGILRKPVVFMVALYRGANRYDVYFERFAEPSTSHDRPSAAAIESMVVRYVARLEYYCRLAPYNWFNFFDLDV